MTTSRQKGRAISAGILNSSTDQWRSERAKKAAKARWAGTTARQRKAAAKKLTTIRLAQQAAQAEQKKPKSSTKRKRPKKSPRKG